MSNAAGVRCSGKYMKIGEQRKANNSTVGKEESRRVGNDESNFGIVNPVSVDHRLKSEREDTLSNFH